MNTLCHALCLVLPLGAVCRDTSPDQRFEKLGNDYVDRSAALAPVAATVMGDHRFDAELDDVSAESRARKAAFYRECLRELDRIDRAELSRANQVDHAVLKHHHKAELWRLDTLQEWARNPLNYTALSGSAIYGLTAREFAPLRTRLGHVADRLEQFPRLLRQVRHTLDPKRVPKIHAETAVKQNRGVLSILDNRVEPHLGELPAEERTRLERAMATAREAVESHQTWLEKELLRAAKGEFRLGAKLYDAKLAFSLQSSLSRREIRQRAEKRFGCNRRSATRRAET